MENTTYEFYKEITEFLDKFDAIYGRYVKEIEPNFLKLDDQKKYEKTEKVFQMFKKLKEDLNDMCSDLVIAKYDQEMEGKWQKIIEFEN